MLRPTRKLSMLGLGGAILVASVTLLGTQMVAQSQPNPTFSVSPTTATPGQTITFSGTGWTCATSHLVLVAVAPLGAVIPVFSTTVTPSPSGSISGTFSAPTALGNYVVVAVGGLVGCGPVGATLNVATSVTTTTTTTTSPPTPPTTTVPPAGAAPITPMPVPVTA